MSGRNVALQTQGHEGAGGSETRANERGCSDAGRGLVESAWRIDEW
jgi:hypothetical protein